MSKYTVTIPMWVPNPRRRRETRKMISAYCQRLGVPVAKGRRHVSMTFQLPTGGDPSSLAGDVLDALIWSGQLKSGSPQDASVDPAGAIYGSPELGTVLEITDLIMEGAGND